MREAEAATSRRAVLVAISSVAALAGCASLAPETAPSTETRAAEPSEWTGRFTAVFTRPGVPGEDESASGRFRLLQNDGRTLLELSTPIGQTIAQAQVDANMARVTDRNGRHYQAASVEALTEQLFGWRVPVLLLPAWLQGRFGAAGRANASQVWSGNAAGWDIRVENWLDHRVVRTLQLNWPAQGTVADRRMRLRLIVDSVT